MSNIKLDIDKVYLTHWSKLIDRKEFLNTHLSLNNIDNIEWVELYDKENWNKEDIIKEYPNIFGLNPPRFNYTNGRYLNESEISLALKHCWIIKDAFNKNYESILILEDDVVLVENFTEKFNSYKNQLPENWDSCFIGTCCDLHAQLVNGRNVYKTNGSRCTHAYILSRNGISKLINEINTINDCIDWYYNLVIHKLQLENYWFEPSIANQNTIYKSTIQQ